MWVAQRHMRTYTCDAQLTDYLKCLFRKKSWGPLGAAPLRNVPVGRVLTDKFHNDPGM